MTTTIVRWGALVCALLSPPLLAAQPFELDMTVDQQQRRNFGFASVEDAADQLSTARLRQAFPGYTDQSTVFSDVNFRGLDAALAFPDSSTRLVFQVSGVALDASGHDSVEFSGHTRDESIEQLKDFLKKNKFALRSLLTRLARTSPIDPLAGNPLSLMSRRARGDFERGFSHRVSTIWGCNCSAFELNREQPLLVASSDDLSGLFAEARDRAAALRAENEIGIGLIGQTMRGTSANGSDYRSWQVELPLSYTVKFDADPRKKLYFELPLSYTDSEGAESYTAGFGIAYTHPLTDTWSLTPAVGVGATGSEDLGAAGGVASYSLASSYTHRLGDWALSLGNLVGRYESIGLKIGDVEAEADIANTVFTNGLMLSGPGSLLARGMVIEYSFTDTRLAGTELFSNRYDEVGVALGFVSTRHGVVTRYFKTGLTYLWGENDIEGLRLNLNLRF